MPDLFDISRHQRTIDWAKVGPVPIVHKVNEGRTVDPRVRERLPIISTRTELFGGYTVLIVSASTIRQQVETYVREIERYWRPGAFTQLDVEPWAQYDRPINVDELEEAQAVHDELLGPGRCTVYINPNVMPREFASWRTRNPHRPLWLPNYSSKGPEQAKRLRAIVHQYTDKHQAPGFAELIDANTVLDRAELERVAGLTRPTPPPGDDDMPTILIFDPVLKATFMVDGTPVSPELKTELAGRGWKEIQQDHPWWRDATLHKMGGAAAARYGALGAVKG